MTLQIRPAVPSDAPQILAFITELATYENAGHEVTASAADIERTLCRGQGPAQALICSQNERTIGFAAYFFNYSTWQGRKGLYLEDLYVSPAHRGVGAGQALLRHLARLACEEGCGRFEWSVLDWNEPAIRLYQTIGAQAQDEWVRYRLAGDALARFAYGDRT